MSISKNDFSKFFGDLRKKYISSNSEIVAKKIIQKYEKEKGVITKKQIQENISFYLEELFNRQHLEFNEVLIQTVENWFDFLINNRGKYKSIENYLGEDFLNKETPISSVSEILKKTGYITHHLVISNNQSSKNRAGKGMEQYFKLLCKKMSIDTEYQQTVSDQEILDFVFPDLESLTSNPSNSIVAEFQTTLADRHRLSLGKLSETKFQKVTKSICTLSGDNLVSNKGENDLTKNKIKEIKNKGWILVLRKKIKEEKFKDDKEIYSFEDFIKNKLIKLT